MTIKPNFKVSMRVVDNNVVVKSDNIFPKKSADALEHSIKKYEWIKRWATKHMGAIVPKFYSSSCALCQIHYEKENDVVSVCATCPVYKMVGRTDCHNTPWQWLREQKTITEKFLHLIDAEISFLKSLR